MFSLPDGSLYLTIFSQLNVDLGDSVLLTTFSFVFFSNLLNMWTNFGRLKFQDLWPCIWYLSLILIDYHFYMKNTIWFFSYVDGMLYLFVNLLYCSNYILSKLDFSLLLSQQIELFVSFCPKIVLVCLHLLILVWLVNINCVFICAVYTAACEKECRWNNSSDILLKKLLRMLKRGELLSMFLLMLMMTWTVLCFSTDVIDLGYFMFTDSLLSHVRSLLVKLISYSKHW